MNRLEGGQRWIHEASGIELQITDVEWLARKVWFILPDGVSLKDAKCEVPRSASLYDLEDRRGWKPAPNHHGWKPSALHGSIGFPVEPTRCRYICGTCADICTRHNNEHGRHYHSVERRSCPAASVELGGYAIERSRDGDWSSWLPPSLMPRVSRPDTLMRAGQIWACRSINSDAAAVVRLHEVGVPVILARRDVAGADHNFFTGVPYGCKAILVQDAGEADPRLPDDLFTDRPNLPIEPHPTAGLTDETYREAMRILGENMRASLDRELVAACAVETKQKLLDDLSASVFGLVRQPPESKEAIINGKSYSFTNIEISMDGVPLKLDGLQSINYSSKSPFPGDALRKRLMRPDYGLSIPIKIKIETDDRLDAMSWYLRSFGYDYGMSTPKIIVPPDLYDKCVALCADVEAEQTSAGYEAPTLTKLDGRREISSNGRDWIPYGMLVDADPFDSYAWRRVVLANGFTQTWGPMVPRQESLEWGEHIKEEKAIGHDQYQADVKRDLARRRPVIHGNVVPGFGDRPSCRPIGAGGIIRLR